MTCIFIQERVLNMLIRGLLYIYIYINYLSNLIYNINFKFTLINFRITENLYNY
jgi:hypothetical protein